MTTKHQCPRCDGRGWIGPVHINRGDQPHEWREGMDCDLCGGTGQIDDDKLAAVELGKKLRAKRVAGEESLMEAARRLGVRPSELSALETGRGGMAAWNHPFATRVRLDGAE